MATKKVQGIPSSDWLSSCKSGEEKKWEEEKELIVKLKSRGHKQLTVSLTVRLSIVI